MQQKVMSYIVYAAKSHAIVYAAKSHVIVYAVVFYLLYLTSVSRNPLLLLIFFVHNIIIVGMHGRYVTKGSDGLGKLKGLWVDCGGYG